MLDLTEQAQRWGQLPSTSYSALGLDIGIKKIGIASGTSLLAEATPRGLISANEGVPVWAALNEHISQWQPELVVIGYPMNMDDTDTFLSPICVRVANKIHGRYGCCVRMVDERLSTREAYDIAINHAHQNWKGKAVDALAAAVILDSWFTQQPC